MRANDALPGECPRFSNSAALPLQIVRDALGQPHLRCGEYRGPTISFSEGGGNLWAALCGAESEVGIDVAGSDEFPGTYPFHRVFHGEELAHALSAAGGDLGSAAALLWSIKEAVVKALGCAFHFVDPRHITVDPGVRDDDGLAFPVSLSGKALRQLSRDADQASWVRAFPQEKRWLSIARLSRHV
ncbi:MAG: 4'-phosphopantetheinyl transferase superfamily protein [Deltaproteobacteria bacterium]|nr:4'-phosphopantetheinyl transferase superfamily protein [Deltaproteobacteria bacterium]